MNKQASGYYYFNNSDKYFCSQRCKFEWLSDNMDNIEQGRPIEFIRHRRESGGYQKVTTTHDNYYGSGTCLLYTSPSPRDRQKSRMPSSA